MQRDLFDNIASIYDKILPSHINRHYLEKRIRFFSRYLKNGFKILDVGCGTGRLMSRLSLAGGVSLYGCDLSIRMLNEVQKKDNMGVICARADDLAYKTEIFDIVISVAVFHHLSSNKEIFRAMYEMVRTAKKGGRVFIWDANSLNPYWLLLFKRVPHDKEVKRAVSLKKIISEAKKLNLADISVFRSGWIPDFAPRRLLFFFRCFEYMMERMPLFRMFSAHNIVVLTK